MPAKLFAKLCRSTALTGVVSAVILCLVPELHASTMYFTTNDLSFAQISFTGAANASGKLYVGSFSATNTGPQTLNNVYFFSSDLSLDGGAATLTSPGDYTVSGSSLFADATNAAVLATPSEINSSFDALSAGSASIAEIPGFLIANALAPGQSAIFDIDFEVPSTTGSLFLGGVATADIAPTPEPSSVWLLGTGAVALAGALKRRLALNF